MLFAFLEYLRMIRCILHSARLPLALACRHDHVNISYFLVPSNFYETFIVNQDVPPRGVFRHGGTVTPSGRRPTTFICNVNHPFLVRHITCHRHSPLLDGKQTTATVR